MSKKILIIAAVILSLSTLSACGKNAASKESSAVSSKPAASSAVSSSAAESSSSAGFPDPESDPLYVKAYTNYSSRNYSTSIKYCDEAIKKDEKCFWAYNVKGIALYFQNGNSIAEKCLTLIDKSVEINPDYSYGYFNRALIEKGTKKWDKSIADFNKVLSYKPNDTWSYYGIATVYADTDDKDNAIKYLKLAINIDSKGVKEQIQDDMSRHYSRLKSDSRFKELLK